MKKSDNPVDGLITNLKNAVYSEDQKSYIEGIFMNLFDKNQTLACNLLTEIYERASDDRKVTFGIMKILHNERYVDVKKIAIPILEKINNKYREDERLQYAIIACLDRWVTSNSLELIKNIRPASVANKEYLENVVEKINKKEGVLTN